MNHNLVSNSESTPAAATPSAKSSRAPVNVWLVDDNRRLRSVMAECLQVFPGVQCTGSFHSPNAVLSALASKPGPDVLLLDIQMGEACGLDAIRSIKSLSRSTQVLMFTTFFDSESETRALTDGASGFLLKSFSMEKILESIHQATKHPTPHLKRSRKAKAATTSPAAKLQNSLSWIKRLRNRWN